MSRVTIKENVKVKRELVSPITTINWDPVANSGTITYNINEMLFIDDVLIRMTPVFITSVTLNELVSKTYEVEIEPGVFTQIPGGLVMLAFKKAFEDSIVESNLGYQVEE
jgi:hypothetical protein